MIRTICLLLVPLALQFLAGCSFSVTSAGGYRFDWRGETAVREESGAVASAVRQIEVKNQFGKVRVEVAQGQPEWSWELTCWSNTLETAESLAAETKLQVSEDAQTQKWEVVLPPPQAELRGLRSNLVLHVPASVRVSVDNSFGDTVIEDVQGGTIARSRHGNLELVGLADSVDAANEHGSIKAERIGPAQLHNRHGAVVVSDVDGDLEVRNEHGKVEVNGVRGVLTVDCEHGDVVANEIAQSAQIGTSHASIRLDGSDGDVTLHNRHGPITARHVRGNIVADNEHGATDLNVDSQEVFCTNRHGEIRLHLRNPELRVVKAETSHNQLRVALPAAMAGDIQAHTEHGKVYSDVPPQAEATVGNNPAGPDLTEPRITLTNRHGNIYVQQVTPESDSLL